ncbi:potassium channel family protein [Fonticella tunisiensis]|uniref:Trk system potassium uptake protein TrkA n=1 Tax=Fonticella tunisiensis TaxID=1096341 RepID=A0A4R7KEN8_9CLOT|nr:NAD-binding protein [Fonticella tunisiensis]TDT52041.1 trk system potassium uptake protein TrkA [Fonticella tunisiensis]
MKAIVVGGGKVGYYLLKTLNQKGYDVTLIERNKKICDKTAEEIDANIICGDGTNPEVLYDADIEKTEVVAAVTGKDEENLVICQIAKVNFNVAKTIARINNPKNRTIFKALGVDRTVCSTEVIANLIEGELNSSMLRPIQTLDRGEMILAEASILRKSPWCSKIISSLDLPEECLIVSILRNDKIIFPKGNVEIKEGDRVLIVTSVNMKDEVERCIMGE